MEEKSDLAKRTLTLKRTFNAPVKLVWEAWAQPEHVAQWWAPKGMKVNRSRMSSGWEENGNM